MTNYKLYIKEKDKKVIENYCEGQIENGELIRIKSIACLLEEHYALYEILQYVIVDLGITKDKIWRGNSISYLNSITNRGHIQICNDLYYDRTYLHQYIVSKELDVHINIIKQYVVHHENACKDNNTINNLYPFYDVSSHIMYHSLMKKGINNIDIMEFSFDYVNELLEHTTNEKDVQAICEYLETLKKLSKATKRKVA